MRDLRRHLNVLICITAAGCAAPEARNDFPAYNPGLIRREPVTQVPLVRAPNAQWLVTAAVNGESGLFVLDTGSDYTVLTPQFAEKLGLLDSAANGSVTDDDGRKRPTKFAQVGHLILGDFDYFDFQAPILNLDHINRAMRTNLDGILGNNILRKTQCTMDWRNQTLTLDSRETAKPAEAIPIHLHGNRIYLTARVNGRLVDFALDTGSYRSLLSEQDLARLRISGDKQRSVNGVQVDFVQARQVRQIEATLDTLKIGGLFRTNYPILIWKHSVVGMDLLQPSVLVIEARENWIALQNPR